MATSTAPDSPPADTPAPKSAPPPLPAKTPAPPPLPPQSFLETPPLTGTPWRLWGALLLFVPLADICTYGIKAMGAGVAVLLLVTGALAAFISHGAGRVALGAAILVPSLAATVIQGGSWPNVAAILAGMSILAWTNRATRITWGGVLVFQRATTFWIFLPGYLRVLIGGIRRVAASRQKSSSTGKFRALAKRTFSALRLVLPAVCISALFLFLLSLGNAALAQKLGAALETLAKWLAQIDWPEIDWPSSERVIFWVFVFLVGGALLVPALQSRRKETEEHYLEKSRADAADPRRSALSWLFGLIGVNLVFLLTNTLDAVYLWIRRAPPAGANTTEYLHEGVYTLIFVTILAGSLLALLFNGGPNLRRSKWLRGLSLVWIFQNAFLMAGVALRLWLHIESAYLTPRRFGVGLFLALVLTGFVLLTIYIFKGKSLRWLIGGNLAATLSLFFVVQFLDIETMCVNDALARRQKDTSLRISGEFLRRVGVPGWRLVHHIVNIEPKSGVPLKANPGDNGRIHEVWKRMHEWLKDQPAPASPQWKSYSWRDNTEAAELCKALGVAEVSPWVIENAWYRTIREVHGRRMR